MKNTSKILILLSAFLLSSWSVVDDTDKTRPDSMFKIESFSIDSISQRIATDDIESNTLRYSSSGEGRINIDSLGSSLKLLSSGSDTIYVKSTADGTLMVSLAVKVIPISQNLNANAGQVETSDKRTLIRDYSLIFIAIILLALLIISNIISSRRKRKLNDLCEDQRDLKKGKKELERLVQDKDRCCQRLFNENQDLKREIIQLREFRSREVVSAFREEMEEATLKSNKLYAVSINDGYFYRITEEPTEDTIFEITKNGERNASFTVYSAVYERVMARPGFLDGCDVQKLSSNPYTLDVEQGSTREEDGRWKVITKVKVKFV